MCIEMNAHALLMLAFILRDKAHTDSNNFLPWMCRSQSCERMFRALRSMTGTFSTIINFNMLGLLRRLHKLKSSNLRRQNQNMELPFLDKKSLVEGRMVQVTISHYRCQKSQKKVL